MDGGTRRKSGFLMFPNGSEQEQPAGFADITNKLDSLSLGKSVAPMEDIQKSSPKPLEPIFSPRTRRTIRPIPAKSQMDSGNHGNHGVDLPELHTPESKRVRQVRLEREKASLAESDRE